MRCNQCKLNTGEALVAACDCGQNRVYHISCLRNLIIATADTACPDCNQRFTCKGIRRIQPLRTGKDFMRRMFYYALIFGLFWIIAHQVDVVIGDYMMAVKKKEQSGSHPKRLFKRKDLCSDCQYRLISSVKTTEPDILLPLSIEFFVPFILTIVSIIYFRHKYRSDIVVDASSRIVILDRYREHHGNQEQWHPKLRLYINGEEVVVQEWDPQMGCF